MQTFFTSDLHFSHKNIIQYSSRPFRDIEEMNEALILNWNSIVGPEDLVYNLGDVCFGGPETAPKYLPRLNGRKILILGNHDKPERMAPYFERIYSYLEITIDKQKFVLCHYPFASWNGLMKGFIHLHGHCHGTLVDRSLIHRIDVGVDSWKYKPVSVKTILQRTLDWKTNLNKVDHHSLGDS